MAWWVQRPGLDLEQEFNEGSYLFHFPDGNASIARLLVGQLIPAATAGTSIDEYDRGMRGSPMISWTIRIRTPAFA